MKGLKQLTILGVALLASSVVTHTGHNHDHQSHDHHDHSHDHHDHDHGVPHIPKQQLLTKT